MAFSSYETKIVHLKTNDMETPIGIDSVTPSFSWQMQSDVLGQKQTAYQIKVSESPDLSNPVWDSGKQTASGSVGISYAGDALTSSTRYFWHVTVWDKDGVKLVSDTAFFETGLLQQSDWDHSEWIQVGTGESDEAGVDYILETDITVANTALGIYFEAKDTNNALMWQLNRQNGLKLKTHYRKAGSYKTIDEVDILPYAVGGASGTQRLKIHVTENGIETFINGISVNTAPKSKLGGIGLDGTMGKFGIRASRTNTEKGSFANFRITDNIKSKVTVLDFSSNPFTLGVTKGVTATGDTLRIDASGGNIDALYAEKSYDVHYKVETRLTSEQGGGVIFNYKDARSFYMWQLNVTNEPGKVLLRPHRCLDGVYANFDKTSHKKDVTNLVGGTTGLAASEVKMTIEVTSEEIITSINDTEVDRFPFSETGGIPAFLGRVGARTDGVESMALSSMQTIDYSRNAMGEVINDYTFESGINPLIKGEIKSGRLVVSGDTLAVPPAGIPTFRKEFYVSKPILSARLYSTALGVYDTYINGNPVGAPDDDGNIVYDVLKPGFTQMDKRVFYHAYDVTSLLNSNGANAISAHVSSGWWSGWVGSFGSGNAFRAQLVITYDDGTQVIGTGTDWKTSYASPILEASIFNGEVYDGNRDTEWMNAGFDDAAWPNAAAYPYSGLITAQVGPSTRIRKDLERAPKSVTVYDGVRDKIEGVQHGVIHVTSQHNGLDGQLILEKGQTAVFDLGQNFAGWAEIAAYGKPGTIIKLRYSEMLNDQRGLLSRGNDGPEGSIYTRSLRTAQATDYYIMKGTLRPETYRPSHTFHGFRYVEVTASTDITIEALSGVVVTSVQRDTGMIKTSDKDVNQLYSNIRWSQYSNYLSVPTDCPQRDERQGWGADTQVFSIAGMYNADSKAFLTKWMQDMRDSQLPNGAYTDVAPYSGWAKEKLTRTGGKEDFGWTDAGLIVPYNIYKMSGDKTILEENYTAMKNFMDSFMANTNKLGGKQDYGDWLGFETHYTDKDVTTLHAISYFAWDALMMAEMAEALGKTADAEKYKAVYEEEKALYIEKNVNPDGSLRRAEQTTCLFALKLNLLPDAASFEKVKQQLLDNIERNGGRLQTGFLGTAVIMQTLTEIGCSDVAYELLLQHEMPSWLYSVDQGATTVWERWNSYTKQNGFGPVDMNSFNHYAYGVVAEWMYGYMAGIMYDKENAGWEHFTLAPQPNRALRFVEGSYDSPYGRISSDWKYENNRFVYRAVVPANTSATVKVPVEAGKSITVNGKAASAVTQNADGIEYTHTENGVAVFEAAAGTFTFSTDISAEYSISLQSDSGVSVQVKINDGKFQKLPVVLKVRSGQKLTIEAAPVNDVDYTFKAFSGDFISDTNKITLTPDKDMDIAVQTEWRGYDNLAENKPVTSDDIYLQEDWKPENLVDGILESTAGNLGFTTHHSTSAGMNHYIEIDLGQNRKFDTIHLYPRTDKLTADGTVASFPKNFEIETKQDGDLTYTKIDTQTNATTAVGKPLVLAYDKPHTARYVRITVTEVTDKVVGENAYYLQLAELGVYNRFDIKEDPVYTLPSGLEAVYGQTLADVPLPNGWTWDEPAVTPVGGAGERIHKATFTPTDTDNFNSVSGIALTITVEKADPVYTLPSGLEAVYGQTLADVPLPNGWTWENSALSVGQVGENDFNAIFTPADPDNYLLKTVSVSVSVSADTAGLEKAIGEAEALMENIKGDIGSGDGQYPPDVVDILRRAIAQAKKAIDAPGSSQESIDAAKAILQKAMDELEQSKILVDFYELNNAIAQVEALQKGDYTDETWQAVQIAAANAKAVVGKANVTQMEVDAAAKTLLDAVGLLAESPRNPENPGNLESPGDAGNPENPGKLENPGNPKNPGGTEKPQGALKTGESAHLYIALALMVASLGGGAWIRKGRKRGKAE